jgi:hypothetical protein
MLKPVAPVKIFIAGLAEMGPEIDTDFIVAAMTFV